MEAKELDKVRCVVSSVSTLLKANGCVSSWSSFLCEARRTLLLLDEINSTPLEEATGCMTEFDLAICGGDENQVVKEQKQNEECKPLALVQSSSGVQRRPPQPLKRHNAGAWADQLA